MNASGLPQLPHRRFNPLTRDWVLVSPHRMQRPWLGKVEEVPLQAQLTYDPNCYLCPGNARAGGARNPNYTETFIFDNDYPALLSDVSELNVDEGGLIVAQTERGICRVVCFSPQHDLTISHMNANQVRPVVDAWVEQFESLEKIEWIQYVQTFENRGAMMGASNPHPHCQVWATATVPDLPSREQTSFAEYHAKHNSCLLCDYLRMELKHGERIVSQNDDFVVLVPYWAAWPFETLVMSKRHVGGLSELTQGERDALGSILIRTTVRYDNLYQVAFPYSMGFHQRPTDRQPHPEWHLHAHYYPPLLRSATVQKFMVGFELLATPQRDLTPEAAAARLRELSDSR